MRRAAVRRRGRRPWIVTEDNPPRPRPLPSFRLFGILGTWMEGDVVAATVRNALAQGCERVYLLDNDSPDNTVARAVEAGATLAGTFPTDASDDDLRARLMNGIVRRVSEGESDDHVWWLWLDADEFPHGPFGLGLRDYLETLDRRFRVVGGRLFNHFPDRAPRYVPGFHPIEFQPLCVESTSSLALRCHHHHPLQRHDRQGASITSDGGFHYLDCAQRPLREPSVPVLIHHFPYREEAATRARMERLFRPDGDGAYRNLLRDTRRLEERGRPSAVRERFERLDAVYGRQPGTLAERLRLDLAPWDLIEPAHARFDRWYTEAEAPVSRS